MLWNRTKHQDTQEKQLRPIIPFTETEGYNNLDNISIKILRDILDMTYKENTFYRATLAIDGHEPLMLELDNSGNNAKHKELEYIVQSLFGYILYRNILVDELNLLLSYIKEQTNYNITLKKLGTEINISKYDTRSDIEPHEIEESVLRIRYKSFDIRMSADIQGVNANSSSIEIFKQGLGNYPKTGV